MGYIPVDGLPAYPAISRQIFPADDLPAVQPTRYYLTVNRKTATTLGLTIPPSLLLRTDELVE
jgi:putative ABC transport system substrate-binding protein